MQFSAAGKLSGKRYKNGSNADFKRGNLTSLSLSGLGFNWLSREVMILSELRLKMLKKGI